MIALCAILLCAPAGLGQQPTIKLKQYTLSGNVGLTGVTLTLTGVTMSGAPASAITAVSDQSGAFSVPVGHGWSGKIEPRMKGYTFEPATRTIPKVTGPISDLAFTGTPVTYKIGGKITGTVPLAGIKLTGFPEEVVTDATGQYTATVMAGFSAKVTPERPGYQFEPSVKTYNDVSQSKPEENYKASERQITISGTAGVAGVKMMGLPGDPVTGGAQGTYRTTVKYGQSYKVKPTLEGYEFTPAEKEYPELKEDQPNQNYTARQLVYQITGSTGMAGVILKGPSGPPVLTNENGMYVVTVAHGSTVTLTPEKPGYTFMPKSIPLTKVTASKDGQDFTAQINQYTISGTVTTVGVPTTPLAGVTLAGLPGDPATDDKGTYKAQVDYGFTGTVTPKKEGFNFTPPTKEYANAVMQNQTQDYKATAILFKITGSAGQPGVTLKATPAATAVGAKEVSALSKENGSFTLEVPYGWTGAIIAQKTGVAFDPNIMPLENVLSDQVNRDFTPRIMQYAVSGRVTDETNNGVEGVTVLGDNDLGTATTDATGKFEFKANHGWKGKLTFTKDGYTLTPPSKLIDMPLQGPMNVPITAKVRMLTIAARLLYGTEPFGDVTVTASTGNIPPVKTDAKGVYSIKVPWGWSGELKFEKEGFDIEPPTKSFPTLTEDMDEISPPKPKPVTPPQTQPPQTQPPQTQPPQTQPPQTQPPQTQPPQAQPSANEQRIQQQIELLKAEQDALTAEISGYRQKGLQAPAAKTQRFLDIQKEMSDVLMKRPGGPTPAADNTGGLAMKQPGDRLPPVAPPRGLVVPPIGAPTLLNILHDLAAKTGVKIITDATVKPDAVGQDLSRVEGLPVLQALDMIVKSTQDPYMVKALDDRTYQVFKPISNTYSGSKLDAALRDISTLANVPIIVDPNAGAGDVNISFENLPLDEALKLMVAGKPLVIKKTKDFYLVAGRGLGQNPSFIDISETRRVRLNYTQSVRVKQLLSPAFLQYVQAEQPNARDPNDQGNVLLVTAAPEIADRIVEDIKRIDIPKRQVLLDARVVSMEKGNLLNLGSEWSWPTIQAGAFASHGLASGAGNAAWPYGVQIGYTPTATFTNALMVALNLLEQNSQADIIANPKVVAQDGRRAEMRVVQEQWFMMQAAMQNNSFYQQAQLERIESGTTLSITPFIGDNNDITLRMAVEVSDSVPKARGSDLPLVTRRTAKNEVTVKDGGTVAVGGLTESRSRTEEKRVPFLGSIPLLGELFKNRNNDKASREVAVFVTAHLVAEGAQTVAPSRLSEPAPVAPVMEASPDDFRQQLLNSMQKPQ